MSCPKLLELRELIGQIVLDQERKVVVFSQWRRMLRLADWATREVLARGNVRAAFFTGDEGQKRRTQNIVEFHDDPACRVLFATDAGRKDLRAAMAQGGWLDARSVTGYLISDAEYQRDVVEQRGSPASARRGV